MKENGVVDMLESLPHAKRVLLGFEEAKNEKRFVFTTRNASPWKLECELAGKDLNFAYKRFTMRILDLTGDF